MSFFVNDTNTRLTLLACRTLEEATIYTNWANECWPGEGVRVENHCYDKPASGEQILKYFGFNIDTLIDAVFDLVPARSQSENNILLFKLLLHNPSYSKHQCCVISNKHPTHYNRLSNAISHYCQLVSRLSGGRNPLKLLRSVRGDI